MYRQKRAIFDPSGTKGDKKGTKSKILSPPPFPRYNGKNGKLSENLGDKGDKAEQSIHRMKKILGTNFVPILYIYI